jgi:hypothetical protein
MVHLLSENKLNFTISHLGLSSKPFKQHLMIILILIPDAGINPVPSISNPEGSAF